MASVTPGYTFTGTTDPITYSKLNLLGQPTVTIGAGEVVASNGSPAGIGYATGSGGTVTQLTNKSTGVTLNTICGAITLNNAALADATNVSFTVTNSKVAAADAVIVNHSSAGTAHAYQAFANNMTAGTFDITVRNVSGGPLSEAIVITFAIIKAATA